MQWAARSQWQVQHQQKQRRQTRVLSYRSDTLCVVSAPARRTESNEAEIEGQSDWIA